MIEPGSPRTIKSLIEQYHQLIQELSEVQAIRNLTTTEVQFKLTYTNPSKEEINRLHKDLQDRLKDFSNTTVIPLPPGVELSVNSPKSTDPRFEEYANARSQGIRSKIEENIRRNGK